MVDSNSVKACLVSGESGMQALNLLSIDRMTSVTGLAGGSLYERRVLCIRRSF